MPYVSETSPTSTHAYSVSSSTNTGGSTYLLTRGKARAQYGWRSGPLSNTERLSIANAAGSHWGDVQRQISALDQMEFHSKGPRTFQVNDRTYQERYYEPAPFEFRGYGVQPSGPLAGNILQRWTKGVLYIDGLSTTGVPAWPSESQARGIAGSILRATVPEKPDFNLSRAAYEQKDFPLLLRAANYLPKSPREAAGAFLNFVFGVQPTISDMRTVSQMVVDLDRPIRDLLGHELAVVSRHGTRTLDSFSDNVTSTIGGTPNSLSGTQNLLGVQFRVANGIIPQVIAGAGQSFRLNVRVSRTRITTLRTFATYEYFIPKPSGIITRLDRYNRIASSYLGGADLASVWEVSPWTWLIDWFVDIGGLLRYQQTIADNNIVMQKAGYTVKRDDIAHVTVSPEVIPGRPAAYGERVVESMTTCTFRDRRVERRKGSPYSIYPDWDLNSMQGAILAALGISKGASGL